MTARDLKREDARRALRTDASPDRTPEGGSGDGLTLKTSAALSASRVLGGIRGRHLVIIDSIGIAFAVYVALSFRNTGPTSADLGWLLLFAAALLCTRLLINHRLGLYSHSWRFASVPDLERIVAAVGIGSLVVLGALLTMSAIGQQWIPDMLPKAFLLVELLVTMAVVAGVRFGIRAATDLSADAHRGSAVDRRSTLLYGAGNIGVMMARSARRSPAAGVRPVGFLDDDPRLKGTSVAGLPVFGGLDALEGAVVETGAQALLITASNAPGGAVRRIVAAATALKLDVRTVPSMVELLDGSVDAYRVRPVRVEDLLRRPAATEHAPEVDGVFTGRTILITGAGGSIGSELARQVMAVGPRRLILVDRAESALFEIHRHLIESFGDTGVEIRQELANVASRSTIRRIVADERPDVILHAAAYKHVPMMEQHPSDAVHVNIAGTLALLDAAIEAGVDRFVLVSTDKAVKPSSVMGASKRVAEMLVADAARRTGRPYVSVRFGNVLGSNGSVVPIFQDQLERGRPLTITHPDMTRYFMTIPEAAWLILDAAALGQEGDLFVLDMGEPVKLMDLARDVVRLAGRDPDSQPFEFIGLRPGEKLHEELFYDAEHVEPTSTPKVLRAVSETPPIDVRAHVGRLMEYATGDHDYELREELSRTVGGFPLPEVKPDGAPARSVSIPITSTSEEPQVMVRETVPH